jgi:tripartite-type tricarboxylate transporter receptor subunit TctC
MNLPALVVAAFAVSLVQAGAGFAQSYPSKPIRIVQPYQAGGPAEGLARIIGNKMSPRLGQPVLIETRVGAGGTIATGYVAKSPPDGYTVLLAHVGPIALSPAQQKDLPYDVLKDFEPVTQLVATPLLLAVRNDIPAHSVKEFIDYAKANPGKLTYGSIGVGSTSHLAGEMLNAAAGIDTLHVPFKGSAQTLVEMMGGRISYSFIGVSGSIQQARAGQIRALAVSTLKRSPNLPDLPAVAETLPGYELNSWYGFMVPAGTPKAVISRLHQEAVLAVRAPDVVEWMKVNGLDPQPSSPEEFGALVRSETDKWARTIKAINIAPN